ncbi:MAG: lipoprotein [Rhizobiaceae bacterium]|nr:lipoprotein [Rhizobiaceae bacterium]
MISGRQVTALVLLIAVGLAVAGCGRKAPLDTPYQAAIEERRQAIEDDAAVIPPEPEKPVEDRPFILDPLI